MKRNLILTKALSITTVVSLLFSTNFHAYASTSQTNVLPVLNGFSTSVFTKGTSSVSNPDDIATMGGNIFIGNQNGVGSDGAASKTGVLNSNVIEYDTTGKQIASFSMVGKCDGLTADPTNNRLIATVNEDGNSSMYVITPSAAASSQVQHITFIAAAGQILPAGGTDSIAIQNGNIYISASAPTPDSTTGKITTAALFQAVINADNTATLTPALMGNATAIDATPGTTTGAPITLNITDADSNNIVPAESPKYAGQVVVDAQGDKQLIFVDKIGTKDQVNTMLPIGNAINDVVWATSTMGTLYITDSGNNTVYSVTGTFAKGTAFVAAPSDSGVAGFVGTVDLTTGTITPFVSGMSSPHGLLFVPSTTPAPTAPALTGAIPTVSGYASSLFATTASPTSKPDDIATMNGNIFVGNQNGVGSDGAASKTGVLNSNVIEYDATGKQIASFDMTGKCDGLTADPANNRLIATVNEDGNSSMYIISPAAAASSQVQHITFIAAAGQTLPAGGTDSIAIQNGNIYVSASAPTADSKGNFTTAALFQAVINSDSTATLTPVLMDNAIANDATPGAAAGATTTLNLSDPDSNNIVPTQSPKYAGQVVLDAQGDSQLIFVDKIGTKDQVNTMLPIGNKINDIVWATSTQGTLYVTDTSDNKIFAITANFAKGTAFVAAPSDSGVAGFVGTVNLTTGIITPIAFGMNSPHGLLFVPNAKVRLGGANRYETSAKVSQNNWTTSDYAVLATGDDFADALCAAPFAKQINAPVLLTSSGSLDASVSAELSRLKVKKVYIVGGNGAISAAVENAVTGMNIAIERISGKDRYETSLKIAQKINKGSQVFLCTGTNFPDALSISSYAAATGNPILLTTKDATSTDILKFISDNKSKVYVIGGTGVIQDTVLNSVSGAERIFGSDRYATNVAVLSKFSSGFNFANIYLATGQNYPDAVCGSASAGMDGAPIILVDSNISLDEKTFIKSQLGKVNTINILGGEGVLSTDTLNKMLN